jgi:hypothetical protein
MSLVINSYNYPYQGFSPVPSTGSQNLIRVSGSGQIQYSSFGEYGINGLYKSTDYGKTWNYVNFINSRIISLGISDSGLGIYLSDLPQIGNNNAYKSSDFGQTWQILNLSPQATGRSYYILNSSNNGNEVMLYTVKGSGTGPVAEPPQMVRSIDGGNTFTYITPNSSLPVSIDDWSIKSSRDFSLIYAKRFNFASFPSTGASELYKSIDYGLNWVKCFGQDSNLFAREKVSTSRNGEVVIIHESDSDTLGSIIISSVISLDYGQTWTPYIGNTDASAFSDDNKYISSIRRLNPTSINSQVLTQLGFTKDFPIAFDISMSLDGRYQSIATENLIYINNNFGYGPIYNS